MQQSSDSHSTDPSVRSPGSPMRPAQCWLREGWRSRRFHWRTWFSLDLHYWQTEGSTPCWRPSGRIWRHCQPLSATLNVDLSDEGWQQASLPVRWGGLGVRSAVMLAPSAYLASAASTATLVLTLLPSFLHHISDRSTPNTLAAWQSAVEPSTLAPVDVAATRQRSWDDPCCQRQSTLLLNSAVDDREKARLRASLSATSGAWLQALPISSVGLRMDDDVIQVAVSLRLGANLCEPHTCTCGVFVDARGTHGLACKQSAGRHPRHGLLNDIVWRAMLRAQVPSCKEPGGLSRSDRKHPDSVSRSLVTWPLCDLGCHVT